jgi:hypothetical protein
MVLADVVDGLIIKLEASWLKKKLEASCSSEPIGTFNADCDGHLRPTALLSGTTNAAGHVRAMADEMSRSGEQYPLR